MRATLVFAALLFFAAPAAADVVGYEESFDDCPSGRGTVMDHDGSHQCIEERAEDDAEEESGGCAVSPGASGGAILWALALGLGLARRR